MRNLLPLIAVPVAIVLLVFVANAQTTDDEEEPKECKWVFKHDLTHTETSGNAEGYFYNECDGSVVYRFNEDYNSERITYSTFRLGS